LFDAASLDEDELLNCNWLSDDRVALVDRLDCDANDLVGLPPKRIFARRLNITVE
jgi:hypothetical protein